MRLVYRGHSYDAPPAALELTEREILGKYRGTAVRFSSLAPATSTTAVRLSYRGSHYTRPIGMQ